MFRCTWWDWLFNCGHNTDRTEDHHTHIINPATGLPMINDDIAGFDTGGNRYGEDHTFRHPHDCFSDSAFDSWDTFRSTDDSHRHPKD
jgi:hypothetical protein